MCELGDDSAAANLEEVVGRYFEGFRQSLNQRDAELCDARGGLPQVLKGGWATRPLPRVQGRWGCSVRLTPGNVDLQLPTRSAILGLSPSRAGEAPGPLTPAATSREARCERRDRWR